ncbi:ankyrin repeat-containing domain protein [Mycena latifolia]|nr:ankyrin repeat-containing domain protein [Mycena latifolia]
MYIGMTVILIIINVEIRSGFSGIHSCDSCETDILMKRSAALGPVFRSLESDFKHVLVGIHQLQYPETWPSGWDLPMGLGGDKGYITVKAPFQAAAKQNTALQLLLSPTMAEVLGTIASAIQLIDTALKAREYVKDFYNAPAEQRKLFTDLDDLQLLLMELQNRIAASPSTNALQHMVAPLGRFKTMMDKFTVKFELPEGPLSKLSKQLSWTLWNKKEAKEYLQEFESMKTLLNIWLTLGIWDAGQEHKKDHPLLEIGRDQQERSKNTEEKELLDWITSLNFFQRQDDIFSAWQPGTGEWLLSDPQFKNWESGSGGILWCRGIPGAGKTVLSSLVVNHLRSKYRNNDTGVACLYLNHKEREAQTPANLLGSIWKQLVVDRSLPTAAYELYKHHHSRDTRPSLAEVFNLLQAVIGQHLKSYIIVDALDEYPEDQRNILLKHLYVSGLEIKAMEDDICRYVDNQIQKSLRLSKHVQTRPELPNEIKDKIISNAQGMFLLAKLHTESLATKNTVKAVREALQHLPKDLNHTYEEAMTRIKNQNEDDRQLALQALTWVAYAKRPLSVAELREALAIELDATTLDVDNLLDIDIVLSICAGLIIVDEAMSVVRLIHYTTQGYFDSIQPVQFADAHTMIASHCLAYLSFDEFSQLDISYMVHEGVKTHPMSAYSQYLLLHAAEASRQLDLQSGLTLFLEKAHSWQVIWNCLSKFQPAPPWDYIDENYSHEIWPRSPSLLWISAASNLIPIATHLLDQSVDNTCIASGLSAAVYYGYFEMAQLLIKKSGANVTCQGVFYGTALQVASDRGHELVAQFLVEMGADINANGGMFGTALQAASDKGHESVAQFLIEKGADVNACGGEFGTALHAASRGGHNSIAQFLIEMGADVNAQGGQFGTALQAACIGGHEPVVQLLIEMGANVNAQGGMHGTPLQSASHWGYKSVAQFLIEMGADVNAKGGIFGTALQAASHWGHESIARFLIEMGADVNAQGGKYGTALQAASHGGNESVVQFLTEMGADVNAQGGKYGTALQAASHGGNESAVQFLIEMGANVNAQGGMDRTALQAASLRRHESVAQFLLEMRADVNAHRGKYGAALQAASRWGHKSVARFLVEKGADVNAHRGKYETALQAASWGHEAVAQFLIEMGADVNAHGGKYGTALQAASHWGHESVTQFLLEMGADVNAQGGKYGTALHAASICGHEAVACLLIKNGAHLNQNARDTTALWLAAAKGNEAIVQLLIDGGANLNIQGYYGTALQAASIWGLRSVVKLLIENGAQPVSLPERPRSAAGYIQRQWRQEIYEGGLSVKYSC